MTPEPLPSWIREAEKRFLGVGQKDVARELRAKNAWRKKHSAEIPDIPLVVWQAFFLVSAAERSSSIPATLASPAVRMLTKKVEALLASPFMVKNFLNLSPEDKRNSAAVLTLLLLATWDSSTSHPALATNIPLTRWRHLADAFGMWRIRYLMEDIHLMKANPKEYARIQTLVRKQEKVRKKIFSSISTTLRKALQSAKLHNVHIEFRKKISVGLQKK